MITSKRSGTHTKTWHHAKCRHVKIDDSFSSLHATVVQLTNEFDSTDLDLA